MTVYQDQVEDYLWYATYMQGNVNIAGLVYDDLLYEYLDSVDVAYTVNVDMIEESLALTESFDPHHFMFLEEFLDFNEVFGFPSRIKQVAINVIHEPIVSPVDLCHMSIDIIHGVDTYWEEIGDNVHFPTDGTATVGLAFWDTLFESLDLEFEMAPGTPGVWKAVYPVSSDIVNMRHEVDALWYFNNLSDEKLFTYDNVAFGWHHLVEMGIVITDNVQRHLGFKALEDLFLNGRSEVSWFGNNYLQDNLFIYDDSKGVYGFDEQAFESLLLDESLSAPFIEKLTELFTAVDEFTDTGVAGNYTENISEVLEINGSVI
ncbi:MAG: hypothetical protein HOH75_00140 [Chloroflexi bacterium]|nr:hypothetical protein [Chloroflexota bacterium]